VRFLLSVLGVATAVWGLSLVRTASDVWRGAINGAAEDTLIVRSGLPTQGDLPVAYAAQLEKSEGEIEQLTLRYAVDVSQAGGRPRRIVIETTLAESTRGPSELRISPRLLERYGLIAPADVFVRHQGDPSVQSLRLVADPSASDGGAMALIARAPGYAFQKERCDEIKLKLRSKALAEIVSKRADQLFENERVPTVTQTERAMRRDLSQTLGSLFRLIDGLSLVLLSIIAVVIAAMIALATTERTTEYAVLRALGFEPSQIVVIVCAEALLTAVLGASLGVLAAVVSARALGQTLTRAAPDLLTDTSISVSALALGFLGACALALIASISPALTASRVVAAEALRKQG
jgi:putative ABC transport system permease protein